MNAVSVKLPVELDVALEQQARARGLRKSQLMREILESFVNSQSSGRETRLLDRISHLTGSVDGPGDLSTNPDYMDGYGR